LGPLGDLRSPVSGRRRAAVLRRVNLPVVFFMNWFVVGSPSDPKSPSRCLPRVGRRGPRNQIPRVNLRRAPQVQRAFEASAHGKVAPARPGSAPPGRLPAGAVPVAHHLWNSTPKPLSPPRQMRSVASYHRPARYQADHRVMVSYTMRPEVVPSADGESPVSCALSLVIDLVLPRFSLVTQSTPHLTHGAWLVAQPRRWPLPSIRPFQSCTFFNRTFLNHFSPLRVVACPRHL